MICAAGMTDGHEAQAMSSCIRTATKALSQQARTFQKPWVQLLRRGPVVHVDRTGDMHAARDSAHEAMLPASERSAPYREALDRLLEIAAACRSVTVGKQRVGDLTIQSMLHNASCSVWLAHESQASLPYTCAESQIVTTLQIQDVLAAIYSVEERLKWDQESFVNLEVLRESSGKPSFEEVHDVIYCRMPAPSGLSDRDVVQERFLVKLPDMGYAIVMQSSSEAKASELGRPPVPGLVRAETRVSGYILRQRPGGGVVVTALSQTNLGGSVPGWLQNLAKKVGTRKLQEWTQRLTSHCEAQAMAVQNLPCETFSAPKATDALAEDASGSRSKYTLSTKFFVFMSLVLLVVTSLFSFAPRAQAGLTAEGRGTASKSMPSAMSYVLIALMLLVIIPVSEMMRMLG